MTNKFLDNLRVIEFGQFGSIPFAGTFLSDVGADVIKVEPLTGDSWRGSRSVTETEGLSFMASNRGKRGIALNLKAPESAEILRELVLSADAVITNYRPSALRALRIDYESIKAIKDDIVYVAVTALEGDEADSAGYDSMGQAGSGMLAADEKFSPDGVPMPVSAGASVDVGTGYQSCFAVCAGLLRRNATGEGSLIETSLLATGMGFMLLNIFELLDHTEWNGAERDQVKRMARDGVSLRDIAEYKSESRAKAAGYPWWYYRCYEAADGTITVCCLTQAQQDALLQQGEIDPDSGSDLGEMLSASFRKHSVAEWVARFVAHGVPAAVVKLPEELPDDPAMQAAGLVVDVEQPHVMAGHFRSVGPLLRFNGERPAAVRPSPALGQHTTEVLAEIGVSELRIRELAELGVVRDYDATP